MGLDMISNIDKRINTFISKAFLQRMHENGMTLPFYFKTKDGCQEHWKLKSNELHDGNRPIDYAMKDTSMVEAFSFAISPYIDKDSSILELGSNCGVNLNHLFVLGYTDLYGIEINPIAILQMKQSFHELNANIFNSSLEEALPAIPNNSYDLIFSMAVLLHIHPDSNFIFNEIARISRKYICTIEGENSYCPWCFPRNYKRIFESRRFKQIFEIEKMPKASYTMRIFKKI